MKNWQGLVKGFVIFILFILVGCGGDTRSATDKSGLNDSFFPVLIESENGNLLKPCWEYQIVDCESLDPNINITLKVTIDPNTLERESIFNGKLSDVFAGSFSFSYSEHLKYFNEQIFIENQHVIMNLDANIVVTNELIKKRFESIIEYDPFLELFLDRNNLNNFPIGSIYDEQGLINIRLSEIEIEEYPNNPGLNTYSEVTLNKDITPNWKILDKLDIVTIQGKEYLNVVVIEYNHSNDEREKVTYWVVMGIGIVKSIGQYKFFGDPLIVELEKTNFSFEK